MATEKPNAAVRRQLLFEDLFARLADFRGGVHLDRMARHLVTLDYREELVALAVWDAGADAAHASDGGDRNESRDAARSATRDGVRAVVYRPVGRTLIAAPFDHHGVDVEDGDPLWQRVGDPAAWVDANADDCVWVHPRHRWVLDVENDRSSWPVRPA